MKLLLHAPWLLILLLTRQSDPTVEAILREGKADNRVMEHLDYLCNKIGPRLTSSTNLTTACEWTRSEFEKWGLKARIEEWGTFPVGFDRGPWSAKMIAPEEKSLTVCTPSWSPGTNGPVTGPAFLAPKSDDELKEMKEKLKGAWVIVTGGGATRNRVAYLDAGVAGVIQSTGSELIVTSGNSRISWKRLPKLPVIQMIGSQHKKIVKLLKEGTEVKLTIDIKNEFKEGPIKLYNVIADLPGTEKPDEYVVVGGHIDSWDGASGATDNGTGVSTTMEAARLLAKVGAKPKRTIRFMLWSGEEQGLLGSLAYVRANREEMKKISAVLVHDGGTNYLSGIPATESLVPIFEKVFAPVMKLDPEMPFRVRKVKSLSSGGSDHASYLGAGVPAFFWNQSGTAKRRQVYSHEHHTQHDHYPSAISEFQKHSAIVAAVGAWGIANLDDMLPRDGLRARGDAPRGPPRRLLGINCDDDMIITTITPDSAADKAGLKEGDQILKLDGKDIKELDDLREAIQKAPKEAKIVIKRDGKEMELTVRFEN
ncbi:MAG: M20/M25/M40 family metallo-hydrolase [Planctomycetes bacterium]|nr:M20/M25/M40 family metallo-hydrolase [Planctomycetota bacterium]